MGSAIFGLKSDDFRKKTQFFEKRTVGTLYLNPSLSDSDRRRLQVQTGKIDGEPNFKRMVPKTP